MTIAEFLLARIAEDEHAAQRALDQPLGYRWRTLSWLTEANREHGQRHDPARVLAECEAKRRIVELHWPDLSGPGTWVQPPFGYCPTCGEDYCEADGTAVRPEAPCPTLRLLALPYADHPDFDATWSVNAGR